MADEERQNDPARIERDSMGEVRVPAGALYGAQTQRAIENFPLGAPRFGRPFIRALALIKGAAASVNRELGLLGAERAEAIARAAAEVAEGRWDDQFPLTIFQTGSGTSTNMNANEVIARRAEQLLAGAGAMSSGHRIHPNDHVNLGQSSNDVIPTAIHVAAQLELETVTRPGLLRLRESLTRRAAELAEVVTTGRTHLMDAMPLTLGQEFGAWAYQVDQCLERLEAIRPRLRKLPLGGTAVGTGINTHPEFGRRAAARLSELTGFWFVESDNHFAAQGSMDTPAELSALLKTCATALLKIANDLRWLNSGPLAGLGELALPGLQPGSSIMPGKVNPVIAEAAIMACAQVIGNDAAVAVGNLMGNFQLNVMLPLIAHNLLESLGLIGRACAVLAEKAIDGLSVNHERIAERLGLNPILVTTLNPVIGYDRAAQIAKRAYAEGRPIKEVAAAMTDLPSEELNRLLDPRPMTQGGFLQGKSE